MMQIGLGILKWSPEILWQSTPYQLTMAMDGLARSKGYGSTRQSAHSTADLVALAKHYQENDNVS